MKPPPDQFFGFLGLLGFVGFIGFVELLGFIGLGRTMDEIGNEAAYKTCNHVSLAINRIKVLAI